tara:strand:+ start:250 stop:1182 length:933 start_codon:yes stop_codon:yes gene_type:complete
MKINAKIPTSKGMRVIKIIPDLDITKITNTNNKNSVRFKGVNVGAITRLGKIIKNGDYQPEYHIPPVVTQEGLDKYNLESGFHRFTAHKKEQQKTFYVVLVEFFDTDGKSANYWRNSWKINENKEDDKYVKTPRTEDDIVGTIKQFIEDKDITDSEEDIINSLKDIKVKSDSLNKYLSKVYKKIGKKEKAVDNFTKNDLLEIANNYGSNTIAVSFLKTAAVRDDRVTVENFLKMHNEGKNPVIIAKVDNANQAKIIDIRKNKINVLQEIMDNMFKQVQIAMNLNDIQFDTPKIKIKFIAQLYGEKGLYDV